MRALGIDLASQAATTAACIVEWNAGAGRVVAIETGLDDAALIDRARQATTTAIDAPFGWPVPFVDFIAGQHGSVPRPSIQQWTASWRDELRFRRTDHQVQAILGRWPLSVSSDLIAIVAMRCAGLLDQLGVTDRSGVDSVVEVYPALALARWGCRSRGYKGADGAAIRSELLDEVRRACPALTIGPNEVDLCRHSDHAFDALVASLVARAAFLDLADPIPDKHHAAACTEGWIVLPHADALARLADQ